MYLSEYGKIVAEEWERTGELRDKIFLDAFIVMPDHVHGLLWIRHRDNDRKGDDEKSVSETEPESNGGEVPSQQDGREMHLATSSNLPPGLEKRRAGPLSTIIGCFKAAATRRINEKRDTPGETIWQSSFHDHIVRNQKELHRIRHYIRTNPQRCHQSE